ncbi:hypothetical protein [Enterococcus sp. AZ189]|uniref:hypothetical protein n=1 Tax=Enterococcus sp. AZ189 TaxID=2774871 RepID=UPI003F23C2ED
MEASHIRTQTEGMDIYISNASMGAIKKMIAEMDDIVKNGQTEPARNQANGNLEKIAELMRDWEKSRC